MQKEEAGGGMHDKILCPIKIEHGFCDLSRVRTCIISSLARYSPTFAKFAQEKIAAGAYFDSVFSCRYMELKRWRRQK
jgi:hypothetical protein